MEGASSSGTHHASGWVALSLPPQPSQAQTPPWIRPPNKRDGDDLQESEGEKDRREKNRLREVERRKRNKFEDETVRALLGDLPDRPSLPILNFNYNAISGTEQAELVEYLRMLEACSRPPIEDNALSLELRKLWGSGSSHAPKFSIIGPLAEAIADGSYSRDSDIRVVETSEKLWKSLEKGLDRPIFIPAGSPMSNDIVESCKLSGGVISVQDFFNTVLRDGNQMIDVQDTGVKSNADMAREVFVEEVRNRYLHPERRSSPWNGLEIGDRSSTFKGPAEIEKRNLLTQLRFSPSDSVRRPTMGKGVNKRLDSWYIWTEKDSISRQHTDVVGLGTFIWVLDGIKIWYFQPQRKESDRLLWREQGAKGPKGYEDAWVRKPLQKNDIFIMPSSTPHAVWSPQDTLVAGGHFCFRMSEVIRGILRDEEHPELTNDEAPEDIFDIVTDYLTRVIHHQLPVDNDELTIIWLELREYTKKKSVPGPNPSDKRKAHFRNKKEFLARVKNENWLELLRQRLG